jgi:type II secretory pathway component PulM
VPTTFPPADLWAGEERTAVAGYDLPPERLRAIERLVNAGLLIGGAWLLICRPELRRLAAETTRLAVVVVLPAWLAREVREAWRRSAAAPGDHPFGP